MPYHCDPRYSYIIDWSRLPSGVWCEDIELVTELQLLRDNTDNDHLIIAFDQSGRHGTAKVAGE